MADPKNDGVRAAYDLWAATYESDRNLTRDLDAEVTRRVLAGAGRSPAGGQWPLILELGCGTGKNTPFLVQRAGRLLALDFSPGMLVQAAAKVRVDNAAFAVADLTRPWPVAAGAAGLAVFCLVLEHIADLDFIFAQAARALAPGGQVYLSELHPFRQYQGAQANFSAGGETVAVPAYVHHLSDFYTAARAHGFRLEALAEPRHAEDEPDGPPRLATMMFVRDG